MEKRRRERKVERLSFRESLAGGRMKWRRKISGEEDRLFAMFGVREVGGRMKQQGIGRSTPCFL